MEAFYVPDTSKPGPRRPEKKFVDALLLLAREHWGTNANILKHMGYKGSHKNETLRRLEHGKGSDTSARALRDALKRDGADISRLPPMYPEEEPETESWREQWNRYGELLHTYAPVIYKRYVDEMRDLAGALERQAKAERDISRAT